MKRIYLIMLLIVLVLLSACRKDDPPVSTPVRAESTAVSEQVPTATTLAVAATAAPLPTPTLPPTATPLPPKAMTICMAQLPQDLYLYGDPSLQATALHHAIYENLYTMLNYDYQPQALVKLPSPDDGDVRVETVTVNLGDEVVDYRGDAHVLHTGLIVIDSEGNQVTVADQPIQMQQITVDFTFKPLIWSDGTPVTAEDSVFSFHIAADPDTPINKRKVQHTSRYEATGPLTVQWTGLPGYLDPDYVTNVWLPLPQHQLGNLSAAELLHTPDTTLTPLSTGPFVPTTFTADELTLVKNENYYRAAEGLPALDIIHVKAMTDTAVLGDETLGGCDVVTQDVLTLTDLPILETLSVQTLTQPSAAYEHIDFGVNFYLAEGFENFIRPDWFQDVRVRQAITQCTDRQRMVDEIFFGRSTTMSAYIPADHPLYPADLQTWPYDPAAANALLDAAGYRDADGDGVREDPVTGQPFAVRLTTDNENPVRMQAAAIFQENLAECGIAITNEYLPPEDWYNDGPLGPLFGRRFELGMFAWLGGVRPTCQLWLERNITGPASEGFGGWGNVNVSGWADADFEAACSTALHTLPGTADYAAAYTAAHQAALRVWMQKLPIIPLFNYLKVAAAQPTVSGVQLDDTQPSELWNIEMWDVQR